MADVTDSIFEETFTPSSGNSVTLSQEPAKVIWVRRNETEVIDWTIAGAVITFVSDGDFGEYGEEIVKVKYAV